MSSCWVALKVQTGHERIVAADLEEAVSRANLTHLVDEIFAAVRSVLINSTNNVVFEAILPGYILVKSKLTNELWHIFKNTVGVFYILNGKVTEEEVEKIRPNCTYEVEIKADQEVTTKALQSKFKEIITALRNKRTVLRMPVELARKIIKKAEKLVSDTISDKKMTQLILEPVRLAV